MLSKYTLKRTSYKIFSKKNSESYNQPHSKRVAIIIIFYPKVLREFFKTQSDQNIHQNASKCTKLHHIYGPEPLKQICV